MGQLIGFSKFRHPLLAILGDRGMTRVVAIEGQLLTIALGDPDSDRNRQDDADDDTCNAPKILRCGRITDTDDIG
jgi:hypothetical protein